MHTKELLMKVGTTLNIFNRTPEEWYVSIMKIRNIGLTEQEILDKINARQDARQKKDWAFRGCHQKRTRRERHYP